MAKIETYATSTPALTDLLLGTDIDATNATKNFTPTSILALLSSAIITLPEYADDAAAGVGGLVTGQLYQTTGAVKIKQ
jgi:hypothetical protein